MVWMKRAPVGRAQSSEVDMKYFAMIVGLLMAVGSTVATVYAPTEVAPVFWITSFCGGLIFGQGIVLWWDER